MNKLKQALVWKLPRWRDASVGYKVAYVVIISINVANVIHTILEIRRDKQWEIENWNHLVDEE